jgi:pilus assembly protein Flp/PilA
MAHRPLGGDGGVEQGAVRRSRRSRSLRRPWSHGGGRRRDRHFKEALVAQFLAFLHSYIATRSPEPDAEGSDRGATMVEYGLIVSVIALVVVVGATVFGDALSTFFNDLAGSL